MTTRMSSFVTVSVIRGHHVYKAIWELANGKELNTEREIGNPYDPLSVAVTKLLREERRTVGHLPRRISPLYSAFVRRGGTIKCIISEHGRLATRRVRGALPATFFIESESVSKKTK